MRNRLLVAGILVLPVALFALFCGIPFAIQKPTGTWKRQNPRRMRAVARKALASASPQGDSDHRFQLRSTARRRFSTTAAGPSTSSCPPGRTAPLEYTNLAPEIVLEHMRHAIHDYDSMFGGNPFGVNAEITAQLSGRNPKGANFIKRRKPGCASTARASWWTRGARRIFSINSRRMKWKSIRPGRIKSCGQRMIWSRSRWKNEALHSGQAGAENEKRPQASRRYFTLVYLKAQRKPDRIICKYRVRWRG